MDYPKIVIFLRCHALPTFVIDTVDSINHYSVSNPTVVLTVDRNDALAEYVQRERPGTLAYVCHKRCGWGAGMHRLFCESARWLVESGMEFDYLINMDYDLIFTREGADVQFLSRFDRPAVGMVGRVNRGSFHWQRKAKQYLPKLVSVLGEMGRRMPLTFVPGECTAGAFNILKSNTVLQMYWDGFLSPPISDICDRVPIADDPMLAFFVGCSGYIWNDIGEGAFIVWQLTEDYENIPRRGYYVFHPTKGVPGNQKWSVESELKCRNFFREMRGQSPLTMDGLPEECGPLEVSV